MSGGPRAARRGQALSAFVVVLAPLTGTALAVMAAARLVADQTRLQAAVDAAAYSAAVLEAETLNEVAVANRALVANLATSGQAVSAVAHLRTLARAARAAQAVGVAFPPLAPALGAAARTADGAAATAAAAARVTVPLARAASALEVARTRAAILAADARLAGRVAARLRAAAPDARLTRFSASALRTAPLSRAIRRARPGDVPAVARGSLDAFTAGRRGAPFVGRTFEVARIGKRGDTGLGDDGTVRATDSIGVTLVRGKRFGATVRVDAAEFGHVAPPRGWRLSAAEGPGAVRVEATLLSVAGRQLTARAAARAVYRRPDRPDEAPDLFGPFWRPRLVPYAATRAVRAPAGGR